MDLKLSKICPAYINVKEISSAGSGRSFDMGARDSCIRDSHSTLSVVQSGANLKIASVPELTPPACPSTASSASNTLDAKRREVVESLMAEFEALFTRHPGVRESPAGSRASDFSSCPNRPFPSSGKERSDDEDPTKDRLNNNGGDGSSDGPGAPRGNWPPILESASGQKLACPYYQRDPGKPPKNRSCTGPGWPSIHRLK